MNSTRKQPKLICCPYFTTLRYFFVTEEEDGDCDAYILKEVATEDDDVVCEMVDDDTELAAVGKIFSELIEDADIEYERE